MNIIPVNEARRMFSDSRMGIDDAIKLINDSISKSIENSDLSFKIPSEIRRKCTYETCEELHNLLVKAGYKPSIGRDGPDGTYYIQPF